MSSIAIITARGDSKRIPGKNIKDFCGKPIIAYSIEAALKSELFDVVMVSTDSGEIADIAKSYGAEVPFMRSQKNSDDYATTADVLHEVISKYEELGQHFDIMCCIYPTAPFVTAEKLKTAYEFMKKNKGDALIPVVKYSFPPQRCFVIRSERIQLLHPENMNIRSQDLEPYYHDAGQFYFWRINKFSTVFAKNTVPYILDDMEVQDIDNIEDWKIAEVKYKNLKKNME